MTDRAAFDGPLGRFVIEADKGEICALSWGGTAPPPATDLLKETCRQLAAYFDGKRQDFDLPIAFQPGLTGDVMRAMCAIPFGETRTYGELSRQIGAPAQAIGQACGANPIPVIVPCHRILAATGLGGFSAPGGIETKIALLKLEGAASLLI